jgi:hypothetical protein
MSINAIWTDALTRMNMNGESSVRIQVRPVDVVRAVTQTVARVIDQLEGTRVLSKGPSSLDH